MRAGLGSLPTLLLTGCLLVLSGCVAQERAQVRDTSDADLEWAREVATDFLAAANADNNLQAATLVDPSMEPVLATGNWANAAEWVQSSVGLMNFTSPVIETERMAPNGDEAVFRGTMNAEVSVVFDFSVRVVKNPESGKWRVGYFHAARRAE